MYAIIQDAADGSLTSSATSFVILDGENAFDSVEPNAFVKAVKSSKVGEIATPVSKPVYAAVNGAVNCNTCGFKGSLDTEFVGESGCLYLSSHWFFDFNFNLTFLPVLYQQRPMPASRKPRTPVHWKA